MDRKWTPGRIEAARVVAVGKLAGVLADLTAAGDVEGARELFSVVDRLLPRPPIPEGVVDLEAERAKREPPR